MKDNGRATHDEFADFLDIIARLRSDEGCPWDREQTPHSMRAYLIEECYEALEAIDDMDADHVREELGDIILLIGMISRMYSETGDFDMGDVLGEINAKLIRRHPHVFGDEKVHDAEEVLKNWERIKVDIEGRSSAGGSALDGVPGNLPPLERSLKIQKRAAKSGFDWPTVDGPKAKIIEEIDEILDASSRGIPHEVEDEVGDLLFSVVNFARHLGVDPTLALARTNRKFESRFREVERRMHRDGEALSPGNIDLMDRYWESVKAEGSGI